MAILLVSCTPSQQGAAVIDGRITGFTDADSISVSLFFFQDRGNRGKEVKSAALSSGKFKFTVDSLPEGLSKYSISHPVIWNDWRDPKGMTGSVRAYQTSGIPTFVVISPEGKILDIIEGFYEDRIRQAVSGLNSLPIDTFTTSSDTSAK